MTMTEHTCPCGAQFKAPPSAVARGRTYCSRECYQRFAYRPLGEQRSTWKGDAVGYVALHDWIRRERGASTECESCGATGCRIEWANASHEYRRELADWLALCKPCHARHDSSTCRRGHERTDANTWIDKQGYPHCRPCRNQRLVMQRQGRRAEWDEGKGQASAIKRRFGA